MLLGLGQGVGMAQFILAESSGVPSVVYELAAATTPGNMLKMRSGTLGGVVQQSVF